MILTANSRELHLSTFPRPLCGNRLSKKAFYSKPKELTHTLNLVIFTTKVPITIFVVSFNSYNDMNATYLLTNRVEGKISFLYLLDNAFQKGTYT